jgi:hypothetical protein
MAAQPTAWIYCRPWQPGKCSQSDAEAAHQGRGQPAEPKKAAKKRGVQFDHGATETNQEVGRALKVKYKQGRDRLKSDDSYCCLGVACEVYHLTTHKGRWTDDRFFTEHSVGGSQATLTTDVSDYFGFSSPNPLITKTIEATTANDGKKWTFEKIAAAVEKYYLTPKKKRT